MVKQVQHSQIWWRAASTLFMFCHLSQIFDVQHCAFQQKVNGLVIIIIIVIPLHVHKRLFAYNCK